MLAFAAAVVAAVIVGVALWHYWYVAAGVLVALAALRALDRSGWAARRREAAQKRREDRLRADADEQHQAYMRGDMAKAAYGRFPAARTWASLDDVPDDVDVYDSGNRVWYMRDGHGERYYRAGEPAIEWDKPAKQGPFTEVL